MEQPKTLKVFWSWQTDSPSSENRNFILSALERAVKNVAKDSGVLITVDRDTKDIGGSPAIVETILAKIRSCDVFVWDATLVHRRPRWAPSANVLMEFGYALALLGDGRIIGIMNTARAPGGEHLPFDLRNRRWPINFKLGPSRVRQFLSRFHAGSRERMEQDKAGIKKALVFDLENALRSAVLEPVRSAIQADADLHVAKAYWSVINSGWMSDWREWRWHHTQYEHKSDAESIWSYLDLSKKAELHFEDERLESTHAAFQKALRAYSATAAREMIPSTRGSEEMYVISTKAGEWHEGYDRNYSRQIEALQAVLEKVFEAWDEYVVALRRKMPALVTSPRED